MRLSKLSYYSDFVVYPVVIGALAAAALAHADGLRDAHWAGAFLAGIGAWTLLEYLLHRIALHAVGYFVPMHALHHRAPRAYVGTPTWLSLAVLCGVILLPIWRFAGFTLASGLTGGMMLGYLWYGLVHHLIHHCRGESVPFFLKGLRTRHLRHHYSPRKGNFGVTCAFWDHAFGTLIKS
ncbi:MAG TPA: sterol desaturase family protein [Steroidobacteraceae bacterium]|nr:sterol desaturase family protein [Steroidobacteraceae bacterium]